MAAVFLVVVEHYDDHIAGPQCAFSNLEDAMEFSEEMQAAYAGICARGVRVDEMEVYQSLSAALAEEEYGAHFAEMRGEYAEEDTE